MKFGESNTLCIVYTVHDNAAWRYALNIYRANERYFRRVRFHHVVGVLCFFQVDSFSFAFKICERICKYIMLTRFIQYIGVPNTNVGASRVI